MCELALSAQPLTAHAGDGSTHVVPAQSTEAVTNPSPGGKAALSTGTPPKGAEEKLHAEVTQLRRAMETRPTIDTACGILMATFGLSAQTAWSVLVATSQHTNTKLHCLASGVVGSVQGGQLPKAVRKQLAASAKAARSVPPTVGSTS